MIHEARKGDFLTRTCPSTVRTPRLNEKEFLADVLRPFHDAIVKALAPHFHDVFEGEDPADDPELIHSPRSRPISKAAERAIWSTTRLLLLGVKAIERDAINNVVAAEAAEGGDVTPEEVRASLEWHGSPTRRRSRLWLRSQYEAETAEALAGRSRPGSRDCSRSLVAPISVVFSEKLSRRRR
jgi:hypothetical protein